MKPSDFRKIYSPYRLIKLITKTTIWHSNEFLVEQTSGLFTDKCHKFEIPKIQGIFYYKTLRNRITIIVQTIFIFLLALSLLASVIYEVDFLPYFLGVLVLITLVFLILKINEGPSCKGFLFTAVGQYELKGLGNMKRAKDIMKSLNNIISDTQGIVNHNEIEENLEEYSNQVTRII